MSNFKTILTAVFAVCIVVGLGVFALSKANSGASVAHVTVWGTVSDAVFQEALRASSIAKSKTLILSYFQKDPTTFDASFVNALAEGTGPDIVLLREDSIYKNKSKLFTIPYANISQRTFKDTFIEGGEIFLYPDGVVALPFMIDPLVMYWNRDLFTNNLIAEPPKFWDQFYVTGTTTSLIDAITRRDASANITQSALAFGEWDNVTNAKEIVSLLLLQAGTPIIAQTSNGLTSVLVAQFDYPITPGSAALNFYTQFSNPTAQTYTWNRALPLSLNFFLSGNLATYVGFASELLSIQQKNPNLNFDVTYVPQIRKTPKKIDFAHMYALSIVKQSKSISSAFLAINALTESSAVDAVGKITNLPPVRRNLLSNLPSDAFRAVFYNSAILSHAWIDPNPSATTNIFRDMINGITSGRMRISESLSVANDSLGALLR